MPIEVRPSTGSLSVGIQADGTISLSSGLCARLGYETGDAILLYYIARGPLVILLRKVTDDEDAFKLSYLNKSSSGESGGKLRSKPFYDKILKPRVHLPQIRLEPILPGDWIYDVGVFVETLDWQRTEFSRNGRDAIDKERIAVYRLLDSRDKILRYGEGRLSERLSTHLKNEILIEQVSFVEWIYVHDKEDAQVIERLLLEEFIEKHGVLPTFNNRRA